MAAFTIMTDSCCDLTAEMAAELELEVLPLSLELSGSVFRNFLDGQEIGFQEFYGRIRKGEAAVTSAVSVGDFEAAMHTVLERGEDVLCICFSSALSTTYQSAVIAASGLQETFPERKIAVVDSLCASMGQGLLVWLCAQEKKSGKSFQEVCAFAEEQKGSICHWFTVDDLYHLKRGGRISAATAIFGSMLSIKPVLHVDAEGRLVNVDKARGRKASLLALVDQMEETAITPGYQTIFISHGDCLEDAKFVASEIRRRFGTQNIHINYVGPVIGSHSGPGPLALFFIGSNR